jgi:hypothetical protein
MEKIHQIFCINFIKKNTDVAYNSSKFEAKLVLKLQQYEILGIYSNFPLS